MVSDPNFANFLLRPINEGKHYNIGGISELMGYTSKIVDEDIDEIISEKMVEIQHDAFTVEYSLDLDPFIKVTGGRLIMVQKISPNFISIIEYIREGSKVAINPVLVIIPLNKLDLDRKSEDYMEQFLTILSEDGVREEFVDFLDSSSKMSAIDDVYFFSMMGDDLDDDTLLDATGDMKLYAVGMLYRFLLLKKHGEEVKVTPDTKLEIKSKLIQDIPEDCFVIKVRDEKGYLGFSK